MDSSRSSSAWVSGAVMACRCAAPAVGGTSFAVRCRYLPSFIALSAAGGPAHHRRRRSALQATPQSSAHLQGMSATTGLRQPAGVPVGGQFAVGAHAEPDGLALVPEASEVDAPPALPCYDIPSARLHDAIAKIDAANRKLERAGIENRFTYQTQEYLKTSTRDAYGYPQDTYELRTKLTLSEPEIAYNGWEFVAALDATEHGFIARTAPGQDLAGWRPGVSWAGAGVNAGRILAPV